jgi:hypothetical protein
MDYTWFRTYKETTRCPRHDREVSEVRCGNNCFTLIYKCGCDYCLDRGVLKLGHDPRCAERCFSEAFPLKCRIHDKPHSMLTCDDCSTIMYECGCMFHMCWIAENSLKTKIANGIDPLCKGWVGSPPRTHLEEAYYRCRTFRAGYTLDLSKLELTEVPPLPRGVKHLYISSNLLTALPELPEGIEMLSVNNNQLTTLPKIPDSVQTIYCERNLLTSIPRLPSKLSTLVCSHNQLSELPELPKKLIILACKNNLLKTLPDLSDLASLDCEDNPLEIPPPSRVPRDVGGVTFSDLRYDQIDMYREQWRQYNMKKRYAARMNTFKEELMMKVWNPETERGSWLTEDLINEK